MDSDISDYDDSYVETRVDCILKRLQVKIKKNFIQRKEVNIDSIVSCLSKHYSERNQHESSIIVDTIRKVKYFKNQINFKKEGNLFDLANGFNFKFYKYSGMCSFYHATAVFG